MNCKIGIPRALYYHYYYPGLEEFFNKMGIDVIISDQTNKKILNKGVKKAVDDLCLPFKAFYGHAEELFDRVDYLFIPRLVSLGKRNSVCPKFMGLPDMLRAAYNERKNLPPFIEPVIDLRKGMFPLRKIAHQIGRKLNINYFRVEYAFRKAVKKHKEFRDVEKMGYTPYESMEILKNGKEKPEGPPAADKNIKIAVLGHSYIVNDKHLSMDLISQLREMGVSIITLEMISDQVLEKSAQRQPKGLFWYYNRHVMGAAYYLLFNSDIKIDGLMLVNAFGCGPDSLVNELVKIRGKKFEDVSLLNINLDEHSGQGGLVTRIEAFIDLLERRKLA